MKDTICNVNADDLSLCLDIIHRSFATVAEDFGLTESNCPGHTAFMKPEKLQAKYDAGNRMFLFYMEGKPVGFFTLRQIDVETWELDHLAVLPEYRCQGIGAALLRYAMTVVAHNNGSIIKIGIIEENAQLKRWYEKFGFIATGTERFAHLPFTVGHMELRLQEILGK